MRGREYARMVPMLLILRDLPRERVGICMRHAFCWETRLGNIARPPSTEGVRSFYFYFYLFFMTLWRQGEWSKEKKHASEYLSVFRKILKSSNKEDMRLEIHSREGRKAGIGT